MGEKKDLDEPAQSRRKRSLESERSSSMDEGKHGTKNPAVKITRGEDGEVIACDVGEEEAYEIGGNASEVIQEKIVLSFFKKQSYEV